MARMTTHSNAPGRPTAGNLTTHASTTAGPRPYRLNVPLRWSDQDLYGHVNNSWLSTVEIPADKGRYGVFDVLRERSEDDVRAIIEESTEAEPGTEIERPDHQRRHHHGRDQRAHGKPCAEQRITEHRQPDQRRRTTHCNHPGPGEERRLAGASSFR